MSGGGPAPRVRGNHRRDHQHQRGRGSIPACAGEPGSARAMTATGAVYPRVCGGTFDLILLVHSALGLSPRVRGNLRSAVDEDTPGGSIPACAGEPLVSITTAIAQGVYPRVCGGTVPRFGSPRNRRGLSPRVRGNHRTTAIGRGKTRSIPACAGEPRNAVETHSSQGVYPRVCGGTPAHSLSFCSAFGLSPRVRGNHSLVGLKVWWSRSIPACAGEPAQARAAQRG